MDVEGNLQGLNFFDDLNINANSIFSVYQARLICIPNQNPRLFIPVKGSLFPKPELTAYIL